MADQFNKDLEKIFDQHDELERTRTQQVQETQRQEDEFLSRFAEVRKTVIRPAFERIGALLEARGHSFKIEESEYAKHGDGKLISSATITMYVAPGESKGNSRPHDLPHIGYHVHYVHTKKVTLFVSTIASGSGTSGGKGDFPLEAITSDLIDQHTLAFLKEILVR